ncbi:MAG: GTP-binding protein, partial [candidate division WWE3 bacterium]|nr:GTP-binding protein [candidate division WWE3 bacterium]
VVAADDGVKPQTVEAIAHAKAAGIPLIVAINKVDLASPQDLTKVKGQLAKEEVITEDQGGKVPAVAVSAKTGQGIPELLEMISLVADLLELKNEPEAPLSAIVIESLLSTQQGPLATLVLKKGMLRVGDQIFAGEVSGKVKALVADTGQRIPAAGPGMPVQVLGFSAVPAVGSPVNSQQSTVATASRLNAPERVSSGEDDVVKSTNQLINQPTEAEGLNVILRADTQGTLEAVVGALGKLKSEGKGINLLLRSVGPIGDSDVRLAATARGVILGFNVPVSPSTQKLADDLRVGVRSFKIIYELLEAAEKLLAGAQALAEEEKVPEAEVLAIFALLSGDVVAGVRVLHGKIKYRDRIKVLRGEEIVHQGKVRGLRIGTENVSEVKGAQEAGVLVKPNFEFQKGDRIVLSS